tara:strand:+ start:616 stop:825 length:210 start_codon:yes stop_codon:yes gene_type:complete
MPNPITRIHDLATGEIIDRPMNAAEMKQAEAEKLAYVAIAAERAEKAAMKAALLERLGINAEEAALLLS